MPTFREKAPPCDGWYVVKWTARDEERAVYLARVPGITTEKEPEVSFWVWGWTEKDDPEAVGLDLRDPSAVEWRPIECAQCEAHGKTIDAFMAERAQLTAEVAALKARVSELGSELDDLEAKAEENLTDVRSISRKYGFDDGVKAAVGWLREGDPSTANALDPADREAREWIAVFIEQKAKAQ